MARLFPYSTLTEARRWLASMIRQERDTKCPMCGRHVITENRPFKPRMAVCLLIATHFVGPGKVFHARSLFDRFKTSSSQAEWSKLRYWGLIKKADKRGYWIVTKSGVAFARGDLAVPSHAVWFRSTFRRLEGELITIRQVEGFNLEAERRKLGI